MLVWLWTVGPLLVALLDMWELPHHVIIDGNSYKHMVIEMGPILMLGTTHSSINGRCQNVFAAKKNTVLVQN